MVERQQLVSAGSSGDKKRRRLRRRLFKLKRTSDYFWRRRRIAASPASPNPANASVVGSGTSVGSSISNVDVMNRPNTLSSLRRVARQQPKERYHPQQRMATHSLSCRVQGCTTRRHHRRQCRPDRVARIVTHATGRDQPAIVSDEGRNPSSFPPAQLVRRREAGITARLHVDRRDLARIVGRAVVAEARRQ